MDLLLYYYKLDMVVLVVVSIYMDLYDPLRGVDSLSLSYISLNLIALVILFK